MTTSKNLKKKPKPRGRPLMNGTPMKRFNVSLDEPTVSKAKRIGDNELSLGLRKAVKAYRLDKRTKGTT